MSQKGRPRERLTLGASCALALAACELIAGLDGDRNLAASGGQGGATGSAGSGVQAGSATAGASGREATGGSGGANEGGEGGEERGGQGGAGGAGEGGSGGGGEGGHPDGPLHPIQSCVETTTCAGESACTTIRVAAGEFPMGRSDMGTDAAPLDGDINELPEHRVRVTTFWLDKYEVTVGRFRRFVESYAGTPPEPGAGAHPRIPQSGWKTEWNDRLPADRLALERAMISLDTNCNESFRTWTPAAGNGECLPVNCVDWYLSYAFCIWDGGRLPTEAEWEYAAAGGDENRLYPWGRETPNDDRAVFQCTAAGDADCSPIDIVEAGSRGAVGAGRFGHADLAGSMLERTRDVYDPTYYGQPAASLENSVNLALDATLIESPARGGNYRTSAAALRGAYRLLVYRTSRWDGVGIRCARNP